MALNRRFAHEIEWSAAYTWSKTTDTASDFDEQPQNPYDLAAEEGRSRYDQRHRFVVSALFELGDADDRQPGTNPGAWARTFGQIRTAPILDDHLGQCLQPADRRRRQSLPRISVRDEADRVRSEQPAFASNRHTRPARTQVLHRQATRETRPGTGSLQCTEPAQRDTAQFGVRTIPTTPRGFRTRDRGWQCATTAVFDRFRVLARLRLRPSRLRTALACRLPFLQRRTRIQMPNAANVTRSSQLNGRRAPQQRRCGCARRHAVTASRISASD